MKEAVMRFQSYQNRAEVLVRNYVLSDPFIPYTSVLGGIFAFKLVYDLAKLISISYVRSYIALPRVLRIEWNNRVVSTVHAIFIGTLSLYFVFWSDLFSDHGRHNDYITLRSSYLSTVSLGVSVGYFVADLGMIIWLYPALGGIEYQFGLSSDHDDKRPALSTRPALRVKRACRSMFLHKMPGSVPVGMHPTGGGDKVIKNTQASIKRKTYEALLVSGMELNGLQEGKAMKVKERKIDVEMIAKPIPSLLYKLLEPGMVGLLMSLSHGHPFKSVFLASCPTGGPS